MAKVVISADPDGDARREAAINASFGGKALKFLADFVDTLPMTKEERAYIEAQLGRTEEGLEVLKDTLHKP